MLFTNSTIVLILILASEFFLFPLPFPEIIKTTLLSYEKPEHLLLSPFSTTEHTVLAQ
jgi:hypothetical protein